METDKIVKGEIYAVIPARAGSKGVRNKNIRCLKGFPLMAYSIAAANLCPCVSRIIVSTDSPEYARIARYYGAEAPFLRPAELAEDSSPDLGFMMHAIQWLNEKEQRLPEYFMHLRPTSPIRKIEIMEDAAKKIKADRTATSLRSAHLSAGTPFKWFCLDRDGYYRSFAGMPIDRANDPRQDFEPVYIPDGYVDMLRTGFVLKENLLHGDRVAGFIVPESIDVDAMSDLEQLERHLDRNEEPLFEYLRENYKTLEEAGL